MYHTPLFQMFQMFKVHFLVLLFWNCASFFLFQEFVSSVERLFPYVTLVLTQQSWPPVIPATVAGLSQRVALQLNKASLPKEQKALNSLKRLMDRYDLIVEEHTEQNTDAVAVLKELMAQKTGRSDNSLYVISDHS